MKLIDKVIVVSFARLFSIVTKHSFIKRKGYYFDVFKAGVLTGLCLYMLLTQIEILHSSLSIIF